jgi:hypothetical protein
LNNLQAIFDAILPENILNNSLISDSTDIFIELLEKNSPVSMNISDFYNIEKITNNTSEELIKIYLYDYYSLIQKLLKDKRIVERFKNENKILRPQFYESDAYDVIISSSSIIDYFTIGGKYMSSKYSDPIFDETLAAEVNINPIYSKLEELKNNLLSVKPDNFYFNRIFKETKGFFSSIKYIYDVINRHLIPIDERSEFQVLDSNTPFVFKVKGSIDKEIYRAGVKYLTHPLGFVYDYEQIRQFKLSDLFSFKYEYQDEIIEVRCLQGSSESYNKKIKNIIQDGSYLSVIFTDGESLVYENQSVKYYNADGKIIKQYPYGYNCSIYLNYKLIYTPNISEILTFKEKKTLDVDTYNIEDVLKTIIEYSPKLGLIIGKFYFNNKDKFNMDSNVYRFITNDDDLEITTILMDRVNLNKKYETQKYKINAYLGIDNLYFNDDLKLIEITYNTNDKIIIDEFNKIKVTKDLETEDFNYNHIIEKIVSFDSKTLEDSEHDNIDSEFVISGLNITKDEFKVGENLYDDLKFRINEVYDNLSDNKTFILVDRSLMENYNISDDQKNKYEILISLNDDIIFNDSNDLNINIKSTINDIIENITDNVSVIEHPELKLIDNYNVDEICNYRECTTFKIIDPMLIGSDIKVGDNLQVTDSDNVLMNLITDSIT